MKTAAAFLFLLASIAAALKASLDYAKKPQAPPPRSVLLVGPAPAVRPALPQAPPVGPGGIPYSPYGWWAADCVGGVVKPIASWWGNPSPKIYDGVQVSPNEKMWGPYGSYGEATAACAAIQAGKLCSP